MIKKLTGLLITVLATVILAIWVHQAKYLVETLLWQFDTMNPRLWFAVFTCLLLALITVIRTYVFVLSKGFNWLFDRD